LAVVLAAMAARGATRRVDLARAPTPAPPDGSADVCVIGELSAEPVPDSAQLARHLIGDRGVIVFCDRDVFLRSARSFLRALPRRCHVYPLMHELLVIEIGIPTLLADASVRARVPRPVWLAADRLGLVPYALRIADAVRAARTSSTAQRVRRLPGALWAHAPAPRPPLGFTVCAIFRNEAPYLAEWIAFHRLQGAERFWLYDNRSDDDWRSAISAQADVVQVTPWTITPGQISAYEDCIRRHRREARWIAFLDLDEFLFSPTGRPVADVLRDFERHAAVAVNWRMYGTNGHEEPPEGLVIENYLLRGTDSHPDNRWVKAIVDPRKTIPVVSGPHSFRHYGVAVGEDHQPAPGAKRAPPTADVLRINHYYTRSESEYARKRQRPNVADGVIRDTAQAPADVVRDDVILQFAAALTRALGDD
jgi:hypothetical protein